MTVFLYVAWLIVGVMFCASFILYMMFMILELEKDAGSKRPDTLYGDCPCCEHPIEMSTDGDIENATYVKYSCTSCNWFVEWRRNKETKMWKKVNFL